MARYVIINADDFGLSRSVNRGIMEAHRLGTVTSATLMVNTPGFEEAVSLARSTPTLGVGMHFNLSYGNPVSNPLLVPSLIKANGSFHGNLNEWTAPDIEQELHQQYQRMLQNGLRPTHLDSHHHIHFSNPLVYSAMKRLALREQLPLRLHPDQPDPELPWHTDTLKMETFNTHTGVTLLIDLLHNAQEGITEILCHPGYVDDDVRRLSTWTTAREEELNVFIDPRIRDCLATLHRTGTFHTIHYGQLPTLRTTHGDLRPQIPVPDVNTSTMEGHTAAEPPPSERKETASHPKRPAKARRKRKRRMRRYRSTRVARKKRKRIKSASLKRSRRK